MAQVNIPRSVPDQFYRYKMAALQAKVEGKGNGIKTVIVNLPTIAKDLDRAPEYITKYFEIELNTQTNIEGEKYSVNGSHTAEQLSKILDLFINRFILCKSCKNPETKIMIKSKAIDLKCAACGVRTPLDMKNKLSSYILKNPPKQASSSKDKTTMDEAPSQPSSKELRKKKKEEEDDDDVVWFTDTSEKSIEERKKNAMGGQTAAVLAMMSIEDEDEEEGDDLDPVEFLKAKLAKSEDLFVAELKNVKDKFALSRSYEVSKVATEALAGGSAATIIAAIKSRKALLEKIASVKDGQYGILLGLEQVYAKDETLLKSILSVFKSLYDEDIVSEEAFLKWAGKSKCKDIKKVAKPFIEWLETADEEDEDEEEEGEEDEEEGEEDEE